MIYEITATYASLIAQYNEAESVPESEAILHQIKQVEALFEEKVDALTRAWRNEELEFNARKFELDRMRFEQQMSESRLAGLKQTLVNVVDSAGLPEPKVKTTIGKLGIQNNSNPSVIFDGEAENLPKKYRKIIPITYEADKTALLEDWKKFEEVIKTERPVFLEELKSRIKDEPLDELYEQVKDEFTTVEDFIVDWCVKAEETWQNELWLTWCESTGFPSSVTLIRGRHPRLR